MHFKTPCWVRASSQTLMSLLRRRNYMENATPSPLPTSHLSTLGKVPQTPPNDLSTSIRIKHYVLKKKLSVESCTLVLTMDWITTDLDTPIDHKLNGGQKAWIVASHQNCHRFLRTHGVIADASYCFTCNVS